MARIKRKLIVGLARAVLSGWKRGILPRSLAFGGIGFLLSLGSSGSVSCITCYAEQMPGDGPYIKELLANPNPTGGADTVRVEALLVDEDWGDDEPGVGGAELFLDSLGQLGEGISMIPKDGQFGSDTERAYLDLDVSAYPPCTLRVFVLGWDITGQEGPPDSLDIEITE